MSEKKTILVCDDDSVFNLTVEYCIKGKYRFLSCKNTDEAYEIIKSDQIDLLILDIKIRTDDEGLKFIPIVKEIDPELGIVIISGSTDFNTVRQAMKLGAWDYISKNFDENDFLHTLEQALEKRSLLQKSAAHKLESEAVQNQYRLLQIFDFIQKDMIL